MSLAAPLPLRLQAVETTLPPSLDVLVGSSANWRDLRYRDDEDLRVHLLPAALEISQWLDAKTDTAEFEYLTASQARSLMNRLTRDLEAADVYTQHSQPAHGAAYLNVFAETSNALLARLRAAH